MKKILLDFYMLKYPNCGFGQIILNYARFFREEYVPQPNLEITLLVPPNYVGFCGDNVKYIKGNLLHRYFPFVFPHFDIWHSMDQRPRFIPINKKTIHIVTIHDFNYEYECRGRRLLYYRSKMNKLIEHVNYIVCISKFTRGELRKFYPQVNKPVYVIYNGVEDMTDKCQSVPCNVDCSKPFVFTIGVVNEKKNFAVLLDVMKQLPQYNLYIAGDNSNVYAVKMQKRILAEHIDNVFLLGTISNEERVWLYKNCLAFVFPSLFEGFGLPVIEAMSLGKPVFSSSETSLKEIGDKYAYFWDNFEPDYMVKVINDGLSDFKRDKGKAQAEIEYAKSYSYKDNISSLFALYNSLL